MLAESQRNVNGDLRESQLAETGRTKAHGGVDVMLTDLNNLYVTAGSIDPAMR
jgi:hypothetical protein